MKRFSIKAWKELRDIFETLATADQATAYKEIMRVNLIQEATSYMLAVVKEATKKK